MIAPIILKDKRDPSSLLTVPPIGYGGVENIMYALINGLIHHGIEVILIGVPGSRALNGMEVVRDARNSEEVRHWVSKNRKRFDIIHDHGCGLIFNKSTFKEIENVPYVATHHQTGMSPYPRNTIYSSFAQRSQAGEINSLVIRIPVNTGDYLFREKKGDYFLYLGRVSEWKGVCEAAAFCKKLGTKLVVAGPAWEFEYFKLLEERFTDTIKYVGNVDGLKRIDLLAEARAVFVLSRFSKGPWGDMWCEPPPI